MNKFMLKSTLAEQIKEAMKAGEALRVSTLRLLSNAIHNGEIAKQAELTEEEETTIVRRQIKQREESIEAYKKGGRQELAEKEAKELAILKKYMPEQMGSEELEKIVTETITELGAQGPQDFGRVMGEVMKKVVGKTDGGTVSEIVRKILKSF